MPPEWRVRVLAIVLLSGATCCAPTTARAATRPHYGGTLKVELRARTASPDPREAPAVSASAAAQEKLLSLAFERLVRIGEDGQPKPELAVSWQSDAAGKRWEFHLRPGVKFHDGTPLTAPAASAALNSLPHDWKAEARGDVLVISSDASMPYLLSELGRGWTYIFRVTPESRVVGTGPFRPKEDGAPSSPGSESAALLAFVANEDHWGGRPFLDAIEVKMGVAAPQQLVDLLLGRADVTELTPAQVRRATLDGKRVWNSDPVELLAVVFDPQRTAAQDARLRDALALALDRSAIASVLLQKQAESAAGLLPQWLSGYAFLFASEANTERAKEILRNGPERPEMTLGYDPGDAEAESIAGRIAVDARAAGFLVRATPNGTNADARLVRLRLAPGSPAASLTALLAALGEPAASPIMSPEEMYAAERTLLEKHRVIPVVHVPELCGLGSRVKDWMASRWGTWRLEDVWLDQNASAAAPAAVK